MSQFSIFGLIFEDFCSYVLLSKRISDIKLLAIAGNNYVILFYGQKSSKIRQKSILCRSIFVDLCTKGHKDKENHVPIFNFWVDF